MLSLILYSLVSIRIILQLENIYSYDFYLSSTIMKIIYFEIKSVINRKKDIKFIW